MTENLTLLKLLADETRLRIINILAEGDSYVELIATKLESKLPHASDWEAVELTERMDGLKFAKACLDEAWDQRGV